jgi:hypothetical protein
MSNEMTLFGNQSNAALALLQGLEDDLTSKIAGSGGSRRISIEGNVFREIIGGKEVRVSDDRFMQVVIINAAPVSRTFYSGTYVKGQKSKPVCWSSDTQSPDPQVPEDQRQAKFCKDCSQNIKGSAANGEGRACRYAQRVAVALASDAGVDDNVYQMNLPATSVFGDADGQKMPLQAYGRYLKAHNTHVISVVTEVRFDPAGQMKLVFKPIRPLNEGELRQALALRDHPDTQKAITMTVSQMDRDEGEAGAPAPAPEPTGAKNALSKPKAEPKAEPKPEPKTEKVEAEEVAEPTKVVKKSAAAEPAEKSDLSDIVSGWDD